MTAVNELAAKDAGFDVWVKHTQNLVETLLKKHLPSDMAEPIVLHQAMRYAVLDGGKRIRPLLALAAGELCGAVSQSALLAGCAVELIHAYSLVHDDMPCMDNDVLRRGKPTVHVQFGQATAMLVGDALQAQAFIHLAQAMPGVNAQARLEMIQVLAQASGSGGMVGGQQIDVLAENNQIALDQLKNMHRKKTGALLSASVTIGGLSGYAYHFEPKMKQDLLQYSQAIGLAFQIVDDILDASQDTHTLGKTSGKDLAQGKSTFVSLLGIEAAQIEAQHCLDTALAAIAHYGVRARRLNELARYIVNRTY